MKPILLVPMAGYGQRFLDRGYTTPKQFIEIGEKTMIEWSFNSFNWKDCEVIFIVQIAQHIQQAPIAPQIINSGRIKRNFWK